MKAKVLMRFRDKDTKKVHNVGDVIEVSPERFNAITAKGKYLEAYVEPKEIKENK